VVTVAVALGLVGVAAGDSLGVLLGRDAVGALRGDDGVGAVRVLDEAGLDRDRVVLGEQLGEGVLAGAGEARDLLLVGAAVLVAALDLVLELRLTTPSTA
jgi:hypothetical protein